MKRKDLVKRLLDMGCVLTRHGRKHDWYTNPVTRTSQPVPRHTEIRDLLARKICRDLGIPPAGG